MELSFKPSHIGKTSDIKPGKVFAMAALAASLALYGCKKEMAPYGGSMPSASEASSAVQAPNDRGVERKLMIHNSYRYLATIAETEWVSIPDRRAALHKLNDAIWKSGETLPDDVLGKIQKLAEKGDSDLSGISWKIIAIDHSKKKEWASVLDLLKSGDDDKHYAAMVSLETYAGLIDQAVLNDALKVILSEVEESHSLSDNESGVLHNAVAFKRDISAIIPQLSRLALTKPVIKKAGDCDIEILKGLDSIPRSYLVTYLAGHHINKMDWDSVRKLIKSHDSLVSSGAAHAVTRFYPDADYPADIQESAQKISKCR